MDVIIAQRFIQHQLFGGFPEVFVAGIEAPATGQQGGFEANAGRFMSVGFVHPEYHGTEQVTPHAERMALRDGRRGAHYVMVGVVGFGTFNKALRELQRPAGAGVHAQSVAITVEAGLVEIKAVGVGFPSRETAGFQLEHPVPKAQRCHAKDDMRGVLPMMAERGIGAAPSAATVHEGNRPQRWFAWIAEISKHICQLAEAVAVGHGKAGDDVVRVLAVNERSAFPGFPGLEQERVAIAAHRQAVEGEHAREGQQSVPARRALEHEHGPVGRIHFVGVAPLPVVVEVLGIIAKEQVAVRHQHPRAEMPHDAEHGRAIGLPTRTRTIAAHGQAQRKAAGHRGVHHRDGIGHGHWVRPVVVLCRRNGGRA